MKPLLVGSFLLMLCYAVANLASPVVRNTCSLHAVAVFIKGSDQSLVACAVTYPRYLLWSGMQIVSRGDFERGIAVLSDRLHSYPDDRLVRYALGNAYESSGNVEAAVTIWKELDAAGRLVSLGWKLSSEQRWREAEAVFRALIDLDADEGPNGLARVLVSQGKLTEAEQVLLTAMVTKPTSKEYANWQFSLGMVLTTAKRWEEARRFYDGLMAQYPDNPDVYIRLGKVWYELGNVDLAIQKIKQAIALSPDKPDGYAALADIFVSQNRYLEADEMYREALRRDPERIWTWVHLANNALSLGDIERAVELYQEVEIRFSGHTSGSLLSTVYLSLSSGYFRANDLVRAKDVLEKAIDLDANNPMVWVTAGNLYEKMNAFEKAGQAYQRALLLDPSNITAKDGLMRVVP